MYATLHGHTGKVNCVKWISPSPSCSFSSLSELLSGEEDGRVLVWSKREEGKEVSERVRVANTDATSFTFSFQFFKN